MTDERGPRLVLSRVGISLMTNTVASLSPADRPTLSHPLRHVTVRWCDGTVRHAGMR